MCRKSRLISLLSILAFFLFAIQVEARTWTDKSGRTIEAEFVRLDGENVIVLHQGMEKPIPLSRLIDADQQYARTARPSASSGTKPSDDPFESGGGQASGESKPSDSGDEEKERDRSGKYPLRDWRDRAGVKSRARLISVQGQDVVLEKNNGIRFNVPFHTLIENDQEYVEKELKKAGTAHLTPSRAPPQNNQGPAGGIGAGQPPPGGYSSPPSGAPPGGYSSPPLGGTPGGFGPPKSGMGPPGGPGGFSAPPSGPPPGYSTPPGGIGPGYVPPSSSPGGPPGGIGGSPPGYSTPPTNPGSSGSPGFGSPPGGYSSPPSGAPPGGYSSPPSGAPPGGFGPPGDPSAPPGGFPPSGSMPPSGAPPSGGPPSGFAPPGGYSSPPSNPGFGTPPGGTNFGAPYGTPGGPGFTGPAYKETYYCTKCNKELPDSVKAGDRCPHCRAYLAYEEGPNGQKKFASGGAMASYFIFGGGGLTALLVIVGVLVRVVISAVRD